MDDLALQGLGPQADTQTQQRAVQYFEQLKSSEDGWQLCGTVLTSGTYQHNDHVKFFCFQVIEHYLKTRYVSSGALEQQTIKNFLLSWLQLQACGHSKDKSFIRNKAAQVFALAFVADYPERWLCLADLLQTLSLGQGAIDMYLRILMAIDSEVVDREIVHTPQDAERNTMLKDAMRQQGVQRMVDSWYQIIISCEATEPELVCSCLDVIGAYVSWIDINLIANERFVSILMRFMSNVLFRESACDCIHEIISKGMEPIAKTKLIESFITVFQNAGILDIKHDEEGDYLAKLGKVINGVGLQLINCWQKLLKSKESENAKIPIQAMEAKFPLMLKFLKHEDDDVSESVAQFSHDYLTVLKQTAPLTDNQKTNVKNLLLVIVEKMKYDDSYSFEHEGEDEAMFQEYRKQLKVIFNNLGALDGELVLMTVFNLVSQTLQHLQSASYQDVEVAITLLYMLGEALPGSYSFQFSNQPGKTTVVMDILRILLVSNVCEYQHSAVQLQFFETIVRYDKFLNVEPAHIQQVLVAFLDERGLRNKAVHVRSRTAYLFSRFVKDIQKGYMQDYLEDVLTRIHDLLVLNSPDNGTKQYLSGDDQLFLYESVGILIVQSHFPPEKKQALMRQLLAPIVNKFGHLLQQMMVQTKEDRQLAYAQCLVQAMAFASRTSKGFSNQQTMKQGGCVEAYSETLKVFLQALDVPVHRPLLHAGVRQFLHRMVVCLGTEILPFIPVAMGNLLKNADAKELHDFIPLINQVVCKFKKHIVPFLQEVFLPVVTTIFRVLSEPVDERDQVAANEKKMLRRGYFSFLATLVNNDVTEVLSNQDVQSLQQVLMTVIQGAVDIPDPQSQKACFGILKKLVEVWGLENGLTGFAEFLYESIVPACFLAPMKPTFDMNDAQTVLALNECAACLKMIMDKRGKELIEFLQTNYLPSLHVAPSINQEFCMALQSEPKVFRSYLKTFFTRAKS